MNTPALAPALPPAMPGPAPAGATRAGDPGAFARELLSATQPKSADADSEVAEARSSADGPDAAAAPGGATAGSPPRLASQTRPNAQKITLQRWLAMARAGAADRGATTDAETPANAAATDAHPALAARGLTDADATKPEAAAQLAMPLPCPAENAAAASGAAGASAAAGAAVWDTASVEASSDAARIAAPGDPAPFAASSVSARRTADGDAALMARSYDAGPTTDSRPLEATSAALAPAAHESRDDAAMMSSAGKTESDAARDPAAHGPLPFASRDEAAGATGTALAAANAAAPPPGFTAELARAGHAAAGAGVNHPANTELHLPTPVTAPDFVPRLSGALAVLARDGVQEAHVQVHPLELGPIAVQITLDGTAAQVRLAVDSPQTRDLLEQGMPSLAAALRENGLTLTGGGVFQQARGQGRDGQEADTPSSRGARAGGDGDAEPVVAVTATRRLRHPGQVDVFA